MDAPSARTGPPAGHIGDKYGRRWSFTFAILQQALGTFLIGVLPTFGTGAYKAGIAAPILLALMRIIQVRGQGGGLCLVGSGTRPAVSRGQAPRPMTQQALTRIRQACAPPAPSPRTPNLRAPDARPTRGWRLAASLAAPVSTSRSWLTSRRAAGP
jgi:hypothetical protein